MDSERFRPLLDAKGPFISIYFDDSHDTQDAVAQLDAKWRDMRKHLEEHSIDAALTEKLEHAVRDTRPPVGRSGRAVIAGADGVVINEHLIRPPVSTVIRISELPYLVPLVEHGVVHTSYLLVAVDHTGADIELHKGGTVHSETVEGPGYPVHKAKKAETSDYGGPQPRVEEALRKNMRAVADRVTDLVDQSGAAIVFVLGELQSRSELVTEFAERVEQRAVELHVGARNTGFHDAEVQHAIGEEFQRRRLAAIDDAAQRFAAGRGTGLAVDGLAAVSTALRDGAVDTLILGEVGNATVVGGEDLAMIAPDADALSELGQAPVRTLPADQALAMVAVATGASIVRTDERIEPADGVAAVLRYAEMSSADTA